MALRSKIASSYSPQSHKLPSLEVTPFEFRGEPNINLIVVILNIGLVRNYISARPYIRTEQNELTKNTIMNPNIMPSIVPGIMWNLHAKLENSGQKLTRWNFVALDSAGPKIILNFRQYLHDPSEMNLRPGSHSHNWHEVRRQRC